MINQVGETFIQEFVVGFGFLSGLWIHIGMNPEAEVIGLFADLTDSLSSGTGISIFLMVIPFLMITLSVIGAFLMGGWPGLIAVGLAFLGGLLISSMLGVILLFAAIILGLFAPSIAGGGL